MATIKYSLRSIFITTMVVAALVAMSYVWRVTVMVYAVLLLLLICIAGADRPER